MSEQTTEGQGLVRGIGLLQATALNMSNMVGVGIFVTIPLIIAAMGGPQCMLGWGMGAILALWYGANSPQPCPEPAGLISTCAKLFRKPESAKFCRSCSSGNSSLAVRSKSH